MDIIEIIFEDLPAADVLLGCYDNGYWNFEADD
jgi:hypothetical protein